MPDDRVERRLAAILAADVVGYSRLMGLDEIDTRDRVNAALSEVIQPSIDAHGGRLFKTMGDGYLAEFPSVVDAVDCAVDIQTAMERRARDTANPIRLRIGVNLGDVIVEADDLHGDGVNVAARLEALADPGGVCISRPARDQIRDKLAYAIDDLGEVEVKNIARPVRVFAVASGPAEAGAGAPKPVSAPLHATRRISPLLALAALVLAVGAGALIWLEPWTPRVAAASVQDMALPLPDKPSIAVLPFAVMSAGEGDQAFADAVAEDLTRSLARLPALFVIARSSTLRYGPEAAPDQVAEDLGVRHIVRASVRRIGDRVRIDAEMVDALSGRITLSERFDRASSDLFALQDDLVRALAARLSADLSRVEDQQRFTSNPEAYLLWAQADAEAWVNTRESYAAALSLADQALALDPGFLRAQAVRAFVTTQLGWFRIAPDPAAAIAEGYEAARILRDQAPDDWYLQAVYAHAVFNTRDYVAGAAEYRKAIDMDPSQARMLTQAALPLIFLGRGAEAEQRLRVAIRLNPFHDWLPDQLLGQALFVQQRYDEAAQALDAAREINPRFLGNLWWSIATWGQLGEADKAAAAVAQLQARVPGVTIGGSFIKLQDEAAMVRYEEGLRKAGLPD